MSQLCCVNAVKILIKSGFAVFLLEYLRTIKVRPIRFFANADRLDKVILNNSVSLFWSSASEYFETERFREFFDCTLVAGTLLKIRNL